MGLKLAKCRLVRRTALLAFVKSHLVNIDYVWIVLLYSEGNTTKLTIRGTSANGAKQGVWGRGRRARKKF
jgi:S-adenosylmethionine synthetase